MGTTCVGGRLIVSEKPDAEQAINTMNGQWLGTRGIRVNWANQKTQTGGGRPSGPPGHIPNFGNQPPQGMGIATPMAMNASPAPPAQSYPVPAPSASYEQIASQTPDYNSTVYVGNLIPYTTQADLVPLFQGYGYIVEIRMQVDRGFAFVKLDTHHNAALAIAQLQNRPVHGRPIKCSWGKDKDTGGGAAPQAPAAQYQQVSLDVWALLMSSNRWDTEDMDTMEDTTRKEAYPDNLDNRVNPVQMLRARMARGTQQQLRHTTNQQVGVITTVSRRFLLAYDAFIDDLQTSNRARRRIRTVRWKRYVSLLPVYNDHVKFIPLLRFPFIMVNGSIAFPCSRRST